MEPNTHMFANDNVDALNAAKNHGAWIPNGSRAGWIQHYKRDIGEVGMEPNTHMFANDNVDTINAPVGSIGIPNGSQAGWMAKGKRDISDKDVDEEVHGFASADTNVLPYAWDRPAEAPKSNYMPSPSGSLAQFEGNGGPEKVHFLEPGYMKHLADTNNQYRGNIRTTFYAQQ